ncbi:MAG: hypothetical protein HYS13_20150 [Planctomycetia bacterium]|nr:hypothetical protein [Planctomycetia bacterium]
MLRAALLSLACLSLVFVSPALAQYGRRPNRPPQGQQQPKLPPVTVTNAKVEGFEQGAIKINNGQQTYLVSPRATKASITGPALPDVLATGMWISFTIKMDQKYSPQEDIAALEIFTPSDVKVPGIQRENDDRVYVSGKLTSLNKTGKVSIQTVDLQTRKPYTIKAQLAEGAKVTLALSDPSVVKYIRVGDTVTVVGKLLKPAVDNQVGLVVGEEFEITLNAAEPLTLAKKKKEKATEKPATEKAAAEKPAAEKPAALKPAAPGAKPAEKPAEKPKTPDKAAG